MRGTTRDAARLADIEAAGAEAVLADPDRLATLLPRLAGVSVACWLMGSAGDPAINGARLAALVEKLVDTPVRGVVYEAAGAAPALEEGAATVTAAARTFAMPAQVVDAHPSQHAAWLSAMRRAVGRVLTA